MIVIGVSVLTQSFRSDCLFGHEFHFYADGYDFETIYDQSKMSSKVLPLKGIKVLEFAGLAPAPLAGLILSGMMIFSPEKKVLFNSEI